MRDVKQGVETDFDSYNQILWSSSSVDKIIVCKKHPTLIECKTEVTINKNISFRIP
jgi:hypothetical protein